MIDLITAAILILAVYRATRFVVEDALPEPVRNKIWDRFPPTHGLGYLITCYWCTSFWVATAFVIAYILVPSVVFYISLILALSATTGIISKLLDRD